MLATALAQLLSLVPMPEGAFKVDAYFDDWAPTEGADSPAVIMLDRPSAGAIDGPDDASARVQMAVSGDRLFVAVQVRDDRFQPGTLTLGDGLTLLFRGSSSVRIQIVLNELEGRVAVLKREGRAYAQGSIASTLRKDGWAVELSLPLKDLPGLSAGESSLALVLRDCDADITLPEGILSTTALGADGFPLQPTVRFSPGAGLYEAYLADQGGFVPLVLARTQGQVVSGGPEEEVVLNARDLVVLGRGLGEQTTYAYYAHGFAPSTTVKVLDLQELDGAPGKDIFVSHVRHAPEVDVDLIEVFGFRGGYLFRGFGQKLGETFIKTADTSGGSARSTFRVLPGRGSRRFEVSVAKVVGQTEFTYPREAVREPAYEPLPLPWNTPRAVMYRFETEAWRRF